VIHLLSLRHTASEEAAGPYAAAHVAFLERHHADGALLVSGQTVPPSDGGAIVATGVDRATAERLTEQDPFVVAGMAAHTITTIDPGRVHPALAGVLGHP
jgi:uncharacterized protein YciI